MRLPGLAQQRVQLEFPQQYLPQAAGQRSVDGAGGTGDGLGVAGRVNVRPTKPLLSSRVSTLPIRPLNNVAFSLTLWISQSRGSLVWPLMSVAKDTPMSKLKATKAFLVPVCANKLEGR